MIEKSNLQLVTLEYSSISQCKEIFGEDEQRYTPWNWSSKRVSQYIPKNAYVLDIASGYGNPYIIKALKDNNCMAEFVDILPTPKDKISEFINYTQCNLENENLPFNKKFNCIVSVSSLEHISPKKMFKILKNSVNLLENGGILAVSIGHFLGVKDIDEVKKSIKNHSYFKNRGYSIYIPLNIKEIIDKLNIEVNVNNIQMNIFPGMENYSDKQWEKNKDICTEKFSDYPELKSHQWLGDIKACEILLVIEKL
ncbi:class I SAM-dependent methyltransferase [Clostridium sp. OS1-26]|uniref:class I SAM-dependent methyltransferase n=1 Tax=Clostridium sp. OS1-26 TaxID=3070681 RepID=UPI0027E0DE25|nr:class I SAM-dependent methyltransferase [Clostridium sp. OS1-26]WML35474.1 class I SAM-dependent methyltransferase [Clostridium sp. OS1-26]